MGKQLATEPDVRVERMPGGVAIITLNRPSRLNALTESMRTAIIDHMRNLDHEDDVRALVLTGAGDRAFAAGQDLDEASAFDASSVDDWIDQWGVLYETILNLRKPSVAAVNGYAIGAAFQMALLCDLRVAAARAQFGMLEIDDAIPCITGTWSLYDLIGRGRTTELILTGRMLTAAEALAWGLISSVVANDELLAAAIALGSTLGSKPPTALQLDKEWMRNRLWSHWHTHSAFAKEAHRKAFASGEPQKRMAAFMSRRSKEPPRQT